MINNTVKVCLLENWNYDISMNHKNLEQETLFQDPFDSVWLKVIGFFSFLIDFFTSTVMLAFINYENEHHGNFRTVINQLLSNLYAMVSKRFALLDIPEIYIIKASVCLSVNTQMYKLCNLWNV